ncbi:AraC family transcriptional regulator [Hymenobacter sp. BT523]|uniref:AraC family transcriptional regulator n=1 Tax=Hymenobacter sp. BT523 TaxID=2795725 RepID=UPI0018EAEAA1|nr:helix-turn-helix domain-containing protein [Hymenobacter sp. BT523]MBJ6111334.1 AraC family transcriptional regulator [Hymenobacter sp. BT523]
MASTLLYIRHMVCVKCILVVREQLVELGLVPLRVELGEVELRDDAATIDWPRLRQCLEAEGFEILDQLSPQQRLVAQIKGIIALLLATEPAALRSGHFSRQLSERLQRRFAYLSDVFSATEGLSLEHYVIRQRVEAARCLLRESTLPVGRVARELGYSNLGHLSRQFQRETGTSPTEYRQQCLTTSVSQLSDEQ